MISASRVLRAPALRASLDAIHGLIQELWVSAGEVNPVDRMRFETIVIEIAGNIIEHSIPANGAVVVSLTLEVVVKPHLIRATFSDNGQEATANLDAVAMPGLDSHTGRGLALAVSLSDSLRYERIGPLNHWTVECCCTAGVDHP